LVHIAASSEIEPIIPGEELQALCEQHNIVRLRGN